MSYIPKYILKRMFPPNCVQLFNDNTSLSIELSNVISPLEIKSDFDFEEYLKKIDKIQLIINGIPVPFNNLLLVELILKDKVYSLQNYKEIIGQTIQVGEIIKFVLPIHDLKIDPHINSIEFLIKATQGKYNIHIKIEREFKRGGNYVYARDRKIEWRPIDLLPEDYRGY